MKAVNTHCIVQIVSGMIEKIDPKRIFATVKPLFKASLPDRTLAKHYQKLARYLAVVVVLRRNFSAFTQSKSRKFRRRLAVNLKITVRPDASVPTLQHGRHLAYSAFYQQIIVV